MRAGRRSWCMNTIIVLYKSYKRIPESGVESQGKGELFQWCDFMEVKKWLSCVGVNRLNSGLHGL